MWSLQYLYTLIKKEDTIQNMESTQEILSRLKLLGHIQKGDKIGSRNMILQPDGWATRITRTLIYPDNRNNTLKLIREILSRSVEILLYNISSDKESNIIQCKIIIQDLIKAQTGLSNLKSTYDTDIKFGCDLDILYQQITARLAEIKKSYGYLFDIDPLQSEIEIKDNSLP